MRGAGRDAVEAVEPIADIEPPMSKTGRLLGAGGEIAEGFGEAGAGLGVELAGETGIARLGGRPGACRAGSIGVVENDGFHVDDGGGTQRPVLLGRFRNVAALEQALDQGGRLGQLAGAGETGRFGHPEGNSVGHVEAFQCWNQP